MYRIVIILIISVFSIAAYGQDVNNGEVPISNNKLTQAAQLPVIGTYEIIVDNIDLNVQLDKETLLRINTERKLDKESFIIVSESVTIKILPFNVIRASSFKPLNKYSYEN